MRTIYRYDIKLQEEQEIYVPELSFGNMRTAFQGQVLKVDMIRGIPSIWCLVDTDMPSRKVKIHLVGTGWVVPDNILNGDYLGSFIIGDSEIYHLFVEY